MPFAEGLKNWKRSIKWKVLFLLFGVFVVISFLVTFLSYHQARRQLMISLQDQVGRFQKMFEYELKIKQNDLQATIQFITHDQQTLQAVAEGDRKYLNNRYVPLFQDVLKPRFGINIFQFHYPPAISFLRIHRPNKFGDDLSRFRTTVVQVNREHKPVSGLEVGKYGPSLRVVCPLSYQGKFIGSVELGTDYAEILQVISSSMNTSFAVAVKSGILEKAGFKLDGAIIEKNGEKFYAFSDEQVRQLINRIELSSQIHMVKLDDMNLVCAAMPLHDFSGKEIGHVFFAFDITNELAAISQNILTTIIFLIFVVVLIGSLLYFVLTKGVFTPLADGIHLAETIAQGDLTQKLNYKSNDEIGQLANALNQMTSSLRHVAHKLQQRAQSLAGQSEEFTLVSANMDQAAKSVNQRSTAVAGAVEELNSNMASISDAAQESTENLGSISAATQEMTSTIAEISQSTARAQQISNQAVQAAQSAHKTVNQLGDSAREIHQVIDVINDIAEQTKLLALNATIEAARAGEAGKGFAVVANEVKELARQTNEATENITEKIEAMRASTTGTMDEIERISQVIEQINEIVTTIASAVEEQTVTTQDMASNVTGATQKVKDVSMRVSEAVEALKQISEEASKLRDEAQEVGNASEQANFGVKELAQMSEELKNIAQKFKI